MDTMSLMLSPVVSPILGFSRATRPALGTTSGHVVLKKWDPRNWDSMGPPAVFQNAEDSRLAARRELKEFVSKKLGLPTRREMKGRLSRENSSRGAESAQRPAQKSPERYQRAPGEYDVASLSERAQGRRKSMLPASAPAE